ncbi:ZIP family metal transporter [Paenibacillaceae bacterium]|nr:ZIP family metal transporter [Paenibacillaceae bacterium]
MDFNFIGMVLCAMTTGLGALPVLFFRKISHRRMDMLLAFTAGIMVAASTYGLIPAALKLSNLAVLCFGVLLGAIVLNFLEQFIPHLDVQHGKSGVILDSKSLMVVAAMAFHNFPEGLSVGASYASDNESLGPVVAFSIGLQNIPEGFLVALFLINQKVNRLIAVLMASLTGVIEIIASLLGFSLAAAATALVPYGLAFAAGAMLFIVYKELIPETHGHGYERAATFSFLVGLLTMIALVALFR